MIEKIICEVIIKVFIVFKIEENYINNIFNYQ